VVALRAASDPPPFFFAPIHSFNGRSRGLPTPDLGDSIDNTRGCFCIFASLPSGRSLSHVSQKEERLTASASAPAFDFEHAECAICRYPCLHSVATLVQQPLIRGRSRRSPQSDTHPDPYRGCPDQADAPAAVVPLIATSWISHPPPIQSQRPPTI
jgi:hypothetical protein